MGVNGYSSGLSFLGLAVPNGFPLGKLWTAHLVYRLALATPCTQNVSTTCPSTASPIEAPLVLTMETFNLEQEPLQPTPLESELVQFRKLVGSVDLGIQGELSPFNQVYVA